MSASLVAFVTTTAGMSWVVSCALKATLLLAVSWLGSVLLRHANAAARHQMWALGVVGALLLPLLCWLLPALLPVSAISAAMGTNSLVSPGMVVTAGGASGAAPSWPTWLALVWAAGAMAVALAWMRGHLAAWRLARAAAPNVPAAWSVAAAEASASLGLARRVELRRSGAIGSPMTIGVLRARVLLPAAADAWSSDRLRAVLVHELGHVRRRDNVTQLAAQLVSAIYWWNPLAWLAAARLRSEREHACDDLVLDAGILPSRYAADLLDVARAVSSDAHAAALCMVDRSWTETRLRRILDATVPRRSLRLRSRLGMTAVALASAVTLACTSSRPALAPAPTGTLTMGAPSVRGAGTAGPSGPPIGSPFVRDPFARPAGEGTLDLSLVSAEVQRRIGGLEQCYQRRLAVNHTLSGTIVIHWVITETGEVPDACITKDTIEDRELTRCVNQLVLEGGSFPAPHGGAVDVEFPFVFAAHATVANR